MKKPLLGRYDFRRQYRHKWQVDESIPNRLRNAAAVGVLLAFMCMMASMLGGIYLMYLLSVVFHFLEPAYAGCVPVIAGFIGMCGGVVIGRIFAYKIGWITWDEAKMLNWWDYWKQIERDSLDAAEAAEAAQKAVASPSDAPS